MSAQDTFHDGRLPRILAAAIAALLLTAAPCWSTEPYFRGRDVFPPGAKHAHSSSIVQCADGSLLACWYYDYGSGERKAADVVIQGARLRAKSAQPSVASKSSATAGAGRWATTWSDVFLMADTPQFPDCNPVLFKHV